jgi:cutinase
VAPHPSDVIVRLGFVAGMVACVPYDVFRLTAVHGGWMGDFIPELGVWITGDHGAEAAVVGYLWRYLGDAAGAGVGFYVVAFALGLHRWSQSRRVVLAAVGYAVFPVWSGLIGLVALAPRGQELMFRLTPATMLITLVGHMIFGLVLGLLFVRERHVGAHWPWHPISLRAFFASKSTLARSPLALSHANVDLGAKRDMNARSIAGLLGAAVAVSGCAVSPPSAAAAPCSDVEVVFARGTSEPPGVGGVGQAFVDSLRQQVGGRAVGVYPVNYPASDDFRSSIPAGANDASTHIQSTAANCPNTRMVLGGYSQGAAVIDVITSQMPPNVANHVAAVAVFGNPSASGTFARALSAGALPGIGPLYVPKTINMCMPGDPICTDGVSMGPHVQYVQSGMTSQAAIFAASRL